MKTTSDSLLDEKSNEIICSECGNPIDGITDFTKRSMKGMGHVSKSESKASFSIACPKCQKKGQPIMKNNVVTCAFCNKEIVLSAPFLAAFKDYIKNNSKK